MIKPSIVPEFLGLWLAIFLEDKKCIKKMDVDEKDDDNYDNDDMLMMQMILMMIMIIAILIMRLKQKSITLWLYWLYCVNFKRINMILFFFPSHKWVRINKQNQSNSYKLLYIIYAKNDLIHMSDKLFRKSANNDTLNTNGYCKVDWKHKLIITTYWPLF